MDIVVVPTSSTVQEGPRSTGNTHLPNDQKFLGQTHALLCALIVLRTLDMAVGIRCCTLESALSFPRISIELSKGLLGRVLGGPHPAGISV